MNCRDSRDAVWRWLMFVGLLHGRTAAQTVIVIEDFEFASSDAAAANGVIDLTEFANTPANYINGDGDSASPNEPGGQYSIGTDAAYCVQFCLPGSFIGFRRNLSASGYPLICPGTSLHYAPLQFSYGDAEQPGHVPADFSVSELTLLWDVYGDGAFCDGLSATHFWLNLVDCEGEVYEFVNWGETALCSTAWTFDLAMGVNAARLSPDSILEVPVGDRLLTEIAAIEVLIQDVNDPPVAIGKWYVDYLRAIEPLPPIAGDADHDGDVDLTDFAVLLTCLTGPDQTAPQTCDEFMLDRDDDVDLYDCLVFQSVFGIGS
jgi:hypothetical protein